MAKVFISLSGDGRGHATRIRALVEALRAEHEITLFTSGLNWCARPEPGADRNQRAGNPVLSGHAQTELHHRFRVRVPSCRAERGAAGHAAKGCNRTELRVQVDHRKLHRLAVAATAADPLPAPMPETSPPEASPLRCPYCGPPNSRNPSALGPPQTPTQPLEPLPRLFCLHAPWTRRCPASGSHPYFAIRKPFRSAVQSNQSVSRQAVWILNPFGRLRHLACRIHWWAFGWQPPAFDGEPLKKSCAPRI
jgi:hypothetical protein